MTSVSHPKSLYLSDNLITMLPDKVFSSMEGGVLNELLLACNQIDGSLLVAIKKITNLVGLGYITLCGNSGAR